MVAPCARHPTLRLGCGGRSNAALGSCFLAVSTEIHPVNRLMTESPWRFSIPLDDCGCLCSTMFRIDPQHMLWSLENLSEGRLVNQIKVDSEVAANARIALSQMLEISARK